MGVSIKLCISLVTICLLTMGIILIILFEKYGISLTFPVFIFIVGIVTGLILAVGLIIHSQLRRMARKTFRAFNECGIFYWVDFGTLLGIIRENNVIFGDQDVDVCILDNNKTHEIMRKCVIPRLRKEGFKVKRMKWSAYRIYTNFNLFVDVYINKINGDTFAGATGKNSNIPKKFIGTPRFHNWDGVNVAVPQNIHETLAWRYGKTYMTPRYGFKGRGEKGKT